MIHQVLWLAKNDARHDDPLRCEDAGAHEDAVRDQAWPSLRTSADTALSSVTAVDRVIAPLADDTLWLARDLARVILSLRTVAGEVTRQPVHLMNSTAGPRPDQFDRLKQSLRDFARERDWEQFHSPKNLAIALSVEAAELLEQFQWLPDDESSALSADKLAKVQDEVADVLIYLIRLSDQLDIDLEMATHNKISQNAAKYPPDKVRASNKKYTEL